MAACASQHRFVSRYRDSEYQEALRSIDATVNDEGVRRLRLQILLLENENDDLHEQLQLADDQIDGLKQDTVDMQAQLARAEEEFSRCKGLLRAQARELSNLKTELAAMNSININSTKVLSEKLALQRELATMKPEMEHLRSQLLNFQAALSEKLALERQVNSLELELEAEKLASRRVTQKNEESARERNHQSETEELQKQLALERRERERDRKSSQKESDASKSQRATMENKLCTILSELHNTQEELRACRTQFSQAKMMAAKVEVPSIEAQVTARHVEKRASYHAAGNASETTNTVGVRAKRLNVRGAMVNQTMVGEKSMFSITPYLHRTIDFNQSTQKQTEYCNTAVPNAPRRGETIGSSPTVSKAGSDHAVYNQPLDNGTATGCAQGKGASQRSALRGPSVPNVLDNSAKTQADTAKVSRSDTSSEDLEAPKPQSGPPLKYGPLKRASTEDLEPKKKKRKLLGNGKTIFDDDDGDATKRPVKIVVNPARRLGRGALHEMRPTIGESDNVLDRAFSPLKRDRKKIGVSYLE